jgi:nuclear RNA export factor
LIISVPAEDSGAVLRVDGWQWAGVNVKIERIGGEADASASSRTEKTRDLLKGVLERRYNIESKFLDLSTLRQDEQLKEQSIFDTKTTAGKFFPAMMRVLEGAFESSKDKDEAVLSVSLADNELTDLTAMSSLSQTLPKLKNLDLSNNKFEKLSQLSLWKKRFLLLEHLILTGNPIEQSEPDYAKSIIAWYPNLRNLNGIQVRSEEDIANRSKTPDIPFPIRSPAFQDEGGIAEGFVRTFIAGFDTDRPALTALYYDEQSDFSYSVNTAAPRDPTSTEQTEKQEWGDYIKNSRNLKKITQLPARQNRMFRGPQAISEVFASLPKTKHADLATEAKKYMIEAHIQPGVPDPSGGSQSGVDGFFVSIHGEFDEMDGATGQPKKKRSFDRTFILGPGGSSGVRIVNDILTVRAYGGAQAFDPDNFEGWNGPAAAAPLPDGVPQLPAGLSVEMAEQMCIELQKQTRMTIGYAKECLEQVNWDFATSLQAFESVKANLPPDAFVAA